MSLWGHRALALIRRQAPTAAACRRADRHFDGAGAIRRSHRAPPCRVGGIARLSSAAAADDAGGVEECARDLSQLSRAELASALAQHLSPGARREIAEARKKIAPSEGEAGGGDGEGGAAAGEAVPEPTRRDLYLVGLNQAIPFVGFGVMDNAILILAGDAIDTNLGVMLGISTLCAAAIGNIISDLAGVGLGTAIEEFAAKLNIPQPNISQLQRQLRSVRFASQLGCALGITFGCIIGMFPLLFIDTKKVEKMKKEAHLDNIFHDMVTEANSLIGAEHTCLYTVVDNDKDKMPLPFSDRQEVGKGQFLYGRYVDVPQDGSQIQHTHTHVPIGKGILSRAALAGKTVNIRDVKFSPDYDYDMDIITAIPRESVRNMVCVPVLDAHGTVIAIIQAINKVGEGTTSSTSRIGFTSKDIQVLRALATHVSVSLENMHDEDAKVTLSDTINILKEHGTQNALVSYRSRA